MTFFLTRQERCARFWFPRRSESLFVMPNIFRLRDHRFVMLVIAAGVLFSVLIWLVLPMNVVMEAMREDGPIEAPSAALHFLVALALLAVILRGAPLIFLLTAVLAAAMGGRELDIHKAMTSGSMTRIAYYLDPEVALLERLGAAVFVIGVVAALLYAAWRYSGTLRRALVQRNPAVWSFAAGVLLVPVLKAIDALPRWIRDIFGATLDENTLALLLSLEEMMEFFLPLVFLTAVIQYATAPKTAPRAKAR